MTTVAESSITPTHLDSTSAAIDADARASYGSASHAGSPLAFATLRPTSDMSYASSVPSPLSYSQQEHEPERDPDRSERTSPHSSYIMTGSEPPRRSSWVGEGEEDRGEQTASESAPAVHILGINYSPNGDGNWNGAIQEEDEESAEGGAGQDSFAAKSSRSPVTPKQTDFHPLRLDGQPSPPPWEVIPPPTSTAEEYHTKAKDSTSSKPRRLIPVSSYYYGPPPIDAAFGTDPIGQIGRHHPREIVRVERDYTGGELVQFAPVYPLELEGRITPTQFLETINTINEVLISAYSLRHSFFDTALDIFSLRISRLLLSTHYEKEMQRLHEMIDNLNKELYNPAGLNILWPRNVAFLFLEIEYY
ncbi:uncharacterized protein STEHIDRAFT_83350 [Stereum hirsutum FP-91666 SS1]|uniref:uncharacterized protein n=1 Tax=Stereum hirsutum (strain FP-91666) TaxID=721885 RepID=UPI0004449886|nr:uncharacterized protein STEHIDRAFT_83350 [Stereum hirsutum FP-91666 SS1]EIM83321.1 hypothetical protein STEHIDRAFT_83350 [Stereum hirsutum FP-91666 SS1]